MYQGSKVLLLFCDRQQHVRPLMLIRLRTTKDNLALEAACGERALHARDTSRMGTARKTKGRSRHKNNNKRVRNMKETKVATKGNSPKQGLTRML